MNTVVRPPRVQDVRGLAPIRVVKSDANLAISTTTGAYVDLDPGGSAAARPLDLVIPNVSAGQWVSVQPAGYSGSAATGVFCDMFTVVAGTPVHQFGDSVAGITAWTLTSTVVTAIGPAQSYQLAADDIENGSVRLRFRTRNGAAVARSFVASSGFQFVLEGRGPFV